MTSLFLLAAITPMRKKDKALTRHLTIINELGLHARSASKIAAIAQHAKSNVWIATERDTVDASSTLDILTLACARGSRVVVRIDDPEDTDILEKISDLVKNGFGE